ncbi:MAG: CHAP domain-containing protein, partial [Deltaproteobacteria bacterium]|nr:CHAP domain-containing protein [Deltaproteobacteria bacterium]
RCQTWPQEAEKKLAVYRIPAGQDAIDVRLALSKKARDMIKKPKFNVAGRQYRRDCSGFVLAVMAQQGGASDVLLTSDFKGGVAAIFFAAVKRGLVHKRKTPAIGDLVFFDNTYDRNRDGRLNDPLTHIGIVERVDADGTVTFIHHVKRGILRYKMNLFTPNLRRDSKTKKVLNHYIRVAPKSAAGSSRKLTGELFHAYATIIR